MYLSIKELEQKKIHFDLVYQAGEVHFEDSKIRQTGPLHAVGTAELLSDTLGEIRVRGHLDVAMEAECDRCLETSPHSVDTEFDLFYRPSDYEPAKEEVRIDEGESEIGFYEGGGLELREVLREKILLELPMQTICRETCKGICPVCGANRNIADCACEVQRFDERWAALRNLQ
ncbi:MAG: YceD family protein [Bryobacteraceae bacterium]